MKRLIIWLGLISLLAACAGAPPAAPQSLAATDRPDLAPPPYPLAERPALPAYPPPLRTAPPPTPPLQVSAAQLAALLGQPDVLAFVTAERSLSLATAAGESAVIWHEGPVESFAWSPDGERIAFVTEDHQLWIWSLADGIQGLIKTVYPQSRPAWTADSAAVAIESGPSGGSPVLQMFAPDGTARQVWPGSEFARHLIFAPTGGGFIAAKNLTVTLDQVEAPLAVPFLWTTADKQPAAFEQAVNVMDWQRAAWSADGEFAAVSNLLLDKQGGVVTQLGPPALGLTGQISSELVANGISPDGAHIAVAGLVRDPGQPGIQQTELEIFARATGTRRAIWRSEPTDEDGFFWRISPVTWSPDGAYLAFAGMGQDIGGPSPAMGIWYGPGDGASLRFLGQNAWNITAETIIDPPQWSATGELLLFASHDPNQPSINIWPANTKALPRMIANGTQPRWRP